MPPKAKPAAAVNDDQRTRDALALLDALQQVTTTVVINVGEIAANTGKKVNTVGKQFNLIKNRYPGLNIQTTSVVGGSSSITPAPATPKARKSTASKAKPQKKSAATVEDDDENEERGDDDLQDASNVDTKKTKKATSVAGVKRKRESSAGTTQKKAKVVKGGKDTIKAEMKAEEDEAGAGSEVQDNSLDTNVGKHQSSSSSSCDQKQQPSTSGQQDHMLDDTVKQLAAYSKNKPIAINPQHPAATLASSDQRKEYQKVAIEDVTDEHAGGLDPNQDTSNVHIEPYLASIIESQAGKTAYVPELPPDDDVVDEKPAEEVAAGDAAEEKPAITTDNDGPQISAN